MQNLPGRTEGLSSGGQGVGLRLGDSQVHYLANLPLYSVVARPELQAVTTARIPADNVVSVSCFYVSVKRIIGGHIPERGRRRGVRRPPCRQRDQLAQLPPGHIVPQAE